MSLKVVKNIKLVILILSLLGCITMLKYFVSEVFRGKTSTEIYAELRRNIEDIHCRLRLNGKL